MNLEDMEDHLKMAEESGQSEYHKWAILYGRKLLAVAEEARLLTKNFQINHTMYGGLIGREKKIIADFDWFKNLRSSLEELEKK